MNEVLAMACKVRMGPWQEVSKLLERFETAEEVEQISYLLIVGMNFAMSLTFGSQWACQDRAESGRGSRGLLVHSASQTVGLQGLSAVGKM